MGGNGYISQRAWLLPELLGGRDALKSVYFLTILHSSPAKPRIRGLLQTIITIDSQHPVEDVSEGIVHIVPELMKLRRPERRQRNNLFTRELYNASSWYETIDSVWAMLLSSRVIKRDHACMLICSWLTFWTSSFGVTLALVGVVGRTRGWISTRQWILGISLRFIYYVLLLPTANVETWSRLQGQRSLRRYQDIHEIRTISRRTIHARQQIPTKLGGECYEEESETPMIWLLLWTNVNRCLGVSLGMDFV